VQSLITISRNQFVSNGLAMALLNVDSSVITGNAISDSRFADIEIDGGVTDLSITCNSILGNGTVAPGIVLFSFSNPGDLDSDITAQFNDIAGHYPAGIGLFVDAGSYLGGPGSLDATKNWWGSASGPNAPPGDSIHDPDGVVESSPFLTAPSPCAALRRVRGGDDITVGSGPQGMGYRIDIGGQAGPGGNTWIAVYDETPTVPDEDPVFGSVNLSEDVLIKTFNNTKGAGLLALYNEGLANKGLALLLIDQGNSDSLVLATVDQAGKLGVLKTVALGAGILENAWYRVSMSVVVTGPNVTVTGKVFKHPILSDPVGPQVGTTLNFSGALPAGVMPTGEVGVIGYAVGSGANSSLTNFVIGP
jgi:hypothetical protein